MPQDPETAPAQAVLEPKGDVPNKPFQLFAAHTISTPERTYLQLLLANLAPEADSFATTAVVLPRCSDSQSAQCAAAVLRFALYRHFYSRSCLQHCNALMVAVEAEFDRWCETYMDKLVRQYQQLQGTATRPLFRISRNTYTFIQSCTLIESISSIVLMHCRNVTCFINRSAR